MSRPELIKWQQDAQSAFAWIVEMYNQAQTLWDDAERYFVEAGWQPSTGGGLGGIAMSQSDMADWPFIYLKVLAATSKEEAEGTKSAIPVFGILFYDEARSGPISFIGAVKWNTEATAHHWAIYSALSGYKNRFKRTSKADETLRRAEPTENGRKTYPFFDELRWVEIPLAAISTARLLKQMVGAALDMADGNDAGALEVAKSAIS